MVTKTFKINKREFERIPLFVFQHKLRSLMRCYTIRDMILDEVNFIVKFKKSHKINGLKMKDPKEYIGKYEVIETESPEHILLKLII